MNLNIHPFPERHNMKKIILGLVAAATVAAPIALTAGSASALVSYNESRVGTVQQKDVQDLFGGNNRDFQGYANSITFSEKSVQVSIYNLICNGEEYTNVVTTTKVTPINATKTWTGSTSNKQVTGWTLDGYGATGSPTVTQTDASARSHWLDCVIAGGDAGAATSNYAQPVNHGVQVSNGARTFDLPVTPVI